MTATLLNSLLRALLRWGAALVFCLPLRHRTHFWARACGMLLPLLLLAQLLDTVDFYYLETHSRMLYYHTSKGEFAARASLQSAEKQLAEYHFVRCNQCYLVNLAYVKGIESDFALVKNDRLEISRRQRTAFLTAVASYMGGVL